MQHKQLKQSNITAFRRFKMSALIGVMLILLGLSNIALFLLTQTPEDAQASPTPIVTIDKTTKETILSENTETAAAPAPAPAPVPATTPQPAPSPRKTVAQTSAPKAVPAHDKVSIASINLSAQFVTVGLTATNAIDVPASVVGWWNGSAQPGTSGAVFLDGHNPGVFSNLPKVKISDQIVISKATGETFTYSVMSSIVVPLIGIDMQAALAPYANAAEGLNLMTCVGPYNPKTGTTDQRLIVYALRI
jgi:sortase (surface protein transpeptidase)